MSGTVIVGVDGSTTSFKAATRAATVAAGLGATLTVVTAYAKDSTEVVEIGNDTWVLDSAEQADKLTNQVAFKLREVVPGATIVTKAVKGKPTEALVTAAEEEDAQLIVVGNVGMKGLGRVLGSVATSVAHNSPCDVYVVKTDA
ncbi:universal stress protein [Zhihengliuella halotolerans]|uniref:Nucleotide-binding universal stress UspA family protein n=1 Tax=Zhihengliuella halotolerans TaxID=370736 RepID=A0A4Q8AFT6_9MICC|nr:universal stress protein [Zhihengliuella halotolerans]MCO1337744.1 universal stress protein UspA [Kocuria polaris]RZU63190.1 nucleotide-binding universal stress UspA family protein [Zhihengliuella halotolerans]